MRGFWKAALTSSWCRFPSETGTLCNGIGTSRLSAMRSCAKPSRTRWTGKRSTLCFGPAKAGSLIRRLRISDPAFAGPKQSVDLLPVHRVRDGLAQLRIAERRLVPMPLQSVPVSDGNLHQLDVRAAFQKPRILRRNLRDEIEFACRQALAADHRGRNIAEDHAIEIGLAFLPISRIALKFDSAAAGPALEYERAGADRIAAEILAVFL